MRTSFSCLCAVLLVVLISSVAYAQDVASGATASAKETEYQVYGYWPTSAMQGCGRKTTRARGGGYCHSSSAFRGRSLVFLW